MHVLTLRRHSTALSLGSRSSAVSPTFRVGAVLQCPSHVQVLTTTGTESFIVGGRCGRLWCIDVNNLLGHDNGAASPVALRVLSSADAAAEFAGLRLLTACLPSRDVSTLLSEAPMCSVVASGLLAPVACLTVPRHLLSTNGKLSSEVQPCTVPVRGLGHGQPPASFLLVLARAPQPLIRTTGHSGDAPTRPLNYNGAAIEGYVLHSLLSISSNMEHHFNTTFLFCVLV